MKSRTGLHLHTRSTSPGWRSMRTSMMSGYLSNFFAGQQLSAIKTSGKSGNKTSIHTSLPHRWSSSMKQARTIEQYIGTIDVLLLGVVQQSMPILCVRIDSAWLPLFPWMDMKQFVLFRALLMGRNFWILLSTTWCAIFFNSLDFY